MTHGVRIALRGASAFSCLGLDREVQVGALRKTRSGLAPIGPESLLAESTLVAGVIPGFEECEERSQTIAERLVDQLSDSARLTNRERRSCSVFAGAASGASSVEELEGLRKLRLGESWRSDLLSGGPSRLTAHVARHLGSHAPHFTYTTACTSTAVALLMAVRMLQAGLTERALVFGVDVLMKSSIEGFRRLQLYSDDQLRPFDRDRSGLQIGEGCVGIVLEVQEEQGGGRFELLDGCVAHDPSHIAAGSNDGRTAAHIMSEALRRSGLSPGDLTAIKAHGTGTISNDRSELRGLQRAFGAAVPPFSSLKGALGHTLGSSCALETVLWTWCLEAGFVPMCQGFSSPEDDVSCEPLQCSLETQGLPGFHLFSAFGFGGTSVSYVLADRGAP